MIELDEIRRRKLERNIALVSTVNVLLAGVVALPLSGMLPFWEECGLGIQDVMAVEAIFWLTWAAWQLPSGCLADAVHPQAALLVGGAVMSCAYVVYMLAQDALTVVMAEMLLATGLAFCCGADQALLSRTLRELGRSGERAARWGVARRLNLFTMAAACMLGGVAAGCDKRLPFLLGAISAGLIVPAAFAAARVQRGERPSVREMLAIARRNVTQDSRLAWMLIFSIFILTAAQTGFWFYQKYLVESCKVDVRWMAAILASFQITAGITAGKADAIARRVGQRAYVLLPVLLAAGYLLLGGFATQASFLFILLHQLVRGFGATLLPVYLEGKADEAVKTTIISLHWMGFGLVNALLFPVAGMFAAWAGLPWTFAAAGLTAIAGGGVLLRYMPEDPG